MDQDAFRNLLANSQRTQSHAKQRVTAKSVPQNATSSVAQPTFKPRKVKKTEGRYRDRAAERREGTGNDYAEVEAVLEDFERRVVREDKDVIEQQRKYLGGDSQHTILVKGLDMSLLEQNRARVAVSTEDDEILEQAFAEATSAPQSEPTRSNKRTREDIVRDLKAKRQNGEKPTDEPVVIQSEGSTLDAAKKAGKFRPIGFKPVGQSEGKPKKRKIKEGKEVVKKKQKVGSTPARSGTNDKPVDEIPAISQERDTIEPSSSKMPRKLSEEPEPTPLDEDFDIFAGAGDYEGFGAGEESEEEQQRLASTGQDTIASATTAGPKGWFNEPESEVPHSSIQPEESPPIPERTAPEEERQETRLQPLQSSTLPSIRDFLAIDEAAGKVEKRRARKEKKKRKKEKGSDDDND